MVAFVRARTKLIFSKLRFKPIYFQEIKIRENKKTNEMSIKKEKSDNSILATIKKEGFGFHRYK